VENNLKAGNAPKRKLSGQMAGRTVRLLQYKSGIGKEKKMDFAEKKVPREVIKTFTQPQENDLRAGGGSAIKTGTRGGTIRKESHKRKNRVNAWKIPARSGKGNGFLTVRGE